MAISNQHQKEPRYMTENDYLEFELKSDMRHEYVGGRVYAMSGAGINHNIINNNVSTILNTQLFGKPCIVVSSDMRIKVTSKDVSYRYPDTVVICGDVQLSDETSQTVTNPIVIIEVLSPSTALKDYNEKLAEYTQISTLKDYVLISQYEAKLELFTRQKEGHQWVYTLVTGLDTKLHLDSIDCSIDLSRLYDKVSLRSTDDN